MDILSLNQSVFILYENKLGVFMTIYPELSDITTEEDLSDFFRKIGVILTSSLQPKDVIHKVMQIIGNYFSPQNWSLLLVEEGTNRLKFEIVMGIDADKIRGVYLEPGEGIVGWVCEHGKPTVIEDAISDPRFSSRIDETIGFRTRSIVCVPLLNGQNNVIGAIELINKIVPPSAQRLSDTEPKAIIPTNENFTHTDMKILSSIGIFTGVAVENAFLYKKVEELAMIDSLTGINNRYYFNEIMRQETERVKRYGHTMCLLMMDIDNFKSINDTFGHVTGDRVLRSIADILRVSVRESDFLARFGGDEFVIVMPEAKEYEAFILAKRIQDMIARWNTKESLQGLKLSISIGIHEAGPHNINQILTEADRELYQCKVVKKKPQELTSSSEMTRYIRYNLEDKEDKKLN